MEINEWKLMKNENESFEFSTLVLINTLYNIHTYKAVLEDFIQFSAF